MAIAFSVAGCATTPESTIHVVRPGENLYRLSQHYGVSVETIRRANDIRDVRQLHIGQRLIIPGNDAAQPSRALASAGSSRSASTAKASRGIRRATGLDFGWPVDGAPSSAYGRRTGRDHDGIDIPAKSGTPVRAAEAGRVIYSGGDLGDYGNVVIVKHAGRY
jgi:murein DD-endopeptidase MepM/ murein hydrolase activator NlpD